MCHIKIPILTVIAGLVLLSLTAVVEAKEVHVFRFSFQVPDAWYVDGGNGETALYATSSSEPYQPPLIIVETCVSTKEMDCEKHAVDPFPYDRIKQKDAYEENYRLLGCSSATVTDIQRENDVVERRLICSTVGYSLFITNNTVLWVAYMPGKDATTIAEFLDTISDTLRVR